MPDLLQFYAGLAENNEKKWFDERKQLYLAIKSYYENLGMEILANLRKSDPDLPDLGPRDISWRIYQDQRFHDRPPYKSWCGLFSPREAGSHTILDIICIWSPERTAISSAQASGGKKN